MPSVDTNRALWDAQYDWPQAGEEWSRVWGGSESQWFGAILPRVHRYVPAGTILEIAPGFGRWTQYLLPLANRLVLVDLSAKCIDACRARFAGHANVSYHVNDGQSLAFVDDGSVDFAFCFDSLVHAELETLDAYVRQLGEKLSADGVAFLHHSNLGSYVGTPGPQIHNPHWRARTVSAESVRRTCAEVGLVCIAQELVNWGVEATLTDCFTTLARPSSRWARECVVVENAAFMAEAGLLRRLAPLYAAPAP